MHESQVRAERVELERLRAERLRDESLRDAVLREKANLLLQVQCRGYHVDVTSVTRLPGLADCTWCFTCCK